ncbi:MAG: response regulator [Pseudomonadota bacterium]
MFDVLIVDDEREIRTLLSEALTNYNFAIHTCRTGREALDAVAQTDYDLILTDIIMPDVDGLEFLQKLRARRDNSSQTPVIAMSGGARSISPECALRAADLYADAVIQKPFDLENMYSAIDRILGKQKQKNAIAKRA